MPEMRIYGTADAARDGWGIGLGGNRKWGGGEKGFELEHHSMRAQSFGMVSVGDWPKS